MDFALNTNYAFNEKYNNYDNNTVTNPVSDSEIEIINSNEDYNYDETYSFQEGELNDDTTPVTTDELKAELEQIKKEQGFFGKTWDSIKNKLPFLSKIGFIGSNEVEEKIEQAESGEITEEEAQEAIEKYKKNQNNATEVILDTITTGAAVGACLLAGPLGWGTLAIIGVATAVGAVTRLGLGAAEAATNEVEGDYTPEDAKQDFTRGGILGLFTGLSKVFGTKISKKIKQKILNKIGKNSDKLSNLVSASGFKPYISSNFLKLTT